MHTKCHHTNSDNQVAEPLKIEDRIYEHVELEILITSLPNLPYISGLIDTEEKKVENWQDSENMVVLLENKWVLLEENFEAMVFGFA